MPHGGNSQFGETQRKEEKEELNITKRFHIHWLSGKTNWGAGKKDSSKDSAKQRLAYCLEYAYAKICKE